MSEGSDITSTATPVLSFLHDGLLAGCDVITRAAT